VQLTPASVGVTDPDSSSFTFNVTTSPIGLFPDLNHGVNWSNATFTTIDLAANHVRFVHDGGSRKPTFLDPCQRWISGQQSQQFFRHVSS